MYKKYDQKHLVYTKNEKGSSKLLIHNNLYKSRGKKEKR